jgi:hypothetical protein
LTRRREAEANAAASEQKHTDALANLLTRHGIADPVVDDLKSQGE